MENSSSQHSSAGYSGSQAGAAALQCRLVQMSFGLHPDTETVSANIGWCFDRIEMSTKVKASESLPTLGPFPFIDTHSHSLQVFKGPAATQDLRFLYTPNMESLCGYTNDPTPGEEYLIAGTEHPPRPGKIWRIRSIHTSVPCL